MECAGPYARTALPAMYVPASRALRAMTCARVFRLIASFLLARGPAMLAARLFGTASCCTTTRRGADISRTGLARAIRGLKLADESWFPPPTCSNVFAKFGYRARVIPNVVDLTVFDYRERRPLRPRLLSTRNLEKYYRVDVIIEAFARFQATCPAATLTIAGYGSEESRLRALAAQLATGGVRFLGKVAPAWMPKLYADSDIYLNASEVDNQPVSILEAFASGLPFISTPTGDIPSMCAHGESWRDRAAPEAAPVAMARAIEDTLIVPSVRCRWPTRRIRSWRNTRGRL